MNYYDLLKISLDHRKGSGIYVIFCSANETVYIGKSVDIQQRRSDHKRYLRNGCHNNKHLQNAYNKYGFNSFIFRVLELCEKSLLSEKEANWIDKISCNVFNERPIDGSEKLKEYSSEWRKKKSENRRKFIKENPNFKKRVSEKQKALWDDPDYRDKQSKSLKGRKTNYIPKESHITKLNKGRLDSEKWSDSIMFRKLTKEQYVEAVETYLSNYSLFGLIRELRSKYNVGKGVIEAAKNKYLELQYN